MTRKPTPTDAAPTRRMRGFEAASGLLRDRIRTAGEARGFAVTRLLTHWAEIVGEDLARITQPVKVGYTREGLGATLTLLTQGASAPMVEMQKDRIRSRVNACYGYNAISRVMLTQSSGAAVIGFAEEQAVFTGPRRDPALTARAAETAAGVTDPSLREALETLAGHILSRPRT